AADLDVVAQLVSQITCSLTPGTPRGGGAPGFRTPRCCDGFTALTEDDRLVLGCFCGECITWSIKASDSSRWALNASTAASGSPARMVSSSTRCWRAISLGDSWLERK